jgi:hypothetical protein
MQSSRQNLAQQATAGMAQSADMVGRLSSHSVRSSYESDTTEGEADIRSLRSFGTTGGGARAAAGAGSAFAAGSSAAAIDTGADALGAAELTGASAQAAPAAADDAALAMLPPAEGTADQLLDAVPELVYSGCCCVGHQGMLLQMLAHLNWHLLEPRQLDKLNSLALLGPSALLEIYR